MTTKNQVLSHCPLSNDPFEGRIDDYFPCMSIFRKSPQARFDVTTRFSGLDQTDDLDKRIWGPHVEVRTWSDTADPKIRIHFFLFPYDQRNKILEDPPVEPLFAKISGWDTLLPVNFLNRQVDVDMAVEFETDFYYIELSGAYIKHLMPKNQDRDLSYIGETITVSIPRPDYEDLLFDMNLSEFFAAMYVANNKPTCPTDKGPEVPDEGSGQSYYEGCFPWDYRTVD